MEVKTKIHILVLSWRDPKHPFAGGAEQVMHEHMKGWIEAGYSVTLFSSYFKGAKKNESLDKVEIVRKGNQLGGVHLAAFLWYLFGKHPKYDLVVDQFHGIPFFTPLYVHKPKLAVLQEVAKEVWFKNDLSFPLNWLYGVVGYLMEPLVFCLYRKTDFMVGSNSAKEDLIKMKIPASRITIVPHGVLISYPKPFPPKEKTKTIVFLGALAKDKGIEDAIKVFSLLKKKDLSAQAEKYQFWVIGKGGDSYLLKLKQMTKKLNIEKNLQFWGFVTKDKKFELLAKAHLLINPSIREGWGLVNIEANSVGTPVVAYNSAGLIDSVKNGVSGVICKENSPEELAKTVFEILNDEKRFNQLQQRAIEWSKNFSWEYSRKLSLSLLESISRNS